METHSLNRILLPGLLVRAASVRCCIRNEFYVGLPMSFTGRQLQVLNAMGIVAWTCHGDVLSSDAAAKHENIKRPDERVVSSSYLAPQNRESSSSLTEVDIDDGHLVETVQPHPIAEKDAVLPYSLPFDELSVSLEATVLWLVNRRLANMIYQGANAVCIGSERASLLVVCLHPERDVQSPLSAQSTQLFDLMMSSIEVPRTEFRQCAISTHAQTSSPHNSETVCLEDMLLAQTRAILILDSRPAAFTNDDVVNKSLLPGSSLPLWRTPHPELLLARPILKRCAWESLKDLKRTLKSVMQP